MKINKNRLIIAIVFVAVVFISAKLALDAEHNETFNTRADTQDKFVEFETGISYRVFPYENYALMVSNDGIRAINQSGDYIWNVESRYSYPFVSVSGKFILHADRTGRDFAVYQAEKQVYSVKTTENILTGKINKNGFSAIATEETGYKGMITVYNSSGYEIYKWHCGEGYIVDADISPDNKKIAVAKISSEGEAVKGQVILIDISANSSVTTTDKPGCLVSYIRFNKDGSLVGLSDSELFGLKSNGSDKFSVDIKNIQLTSFDLSQDNCLVLSSLSSRNNTTLDIYSKDGKKRGRYTATGNLKNISVIGDVILAGQMRTVLRITPSGKAKEVTTVAHDIRSMQLFDSRSKALVIGGSSAHVIDAR